MTTKVTIKNEGPGKVLVAAMSRISGKAMNTKELAKGEEHWLYVYVNQSILVTEIKELI